MRGLLLLCAGVFWAASSVHLLAQGNDNPTGLTGSFNGEVTTGGIYDPYTQNVKRMVTDLVVPGCVGKYPLHLTRYYNSRSGVNQTWGFDLGWGLSDSGGVGTAPDGRRIDFFGFGELGIPTPSQEYLDATGIALPDGGHLVFGQWTSTVNGVTYTHNRQVQMIDPYGLTTNYLYENAATPNKCTKIVEPGGKYLKFITTNDAQGYITQYVVEAHDQNDVLIETVRYTYSAWGTFGGVHYTKVITRIDYDDGTFATLTYKPDNVYNKYALLGSCDDVRFGGAMSKIEYDYKSVAKPADGSFTSVGLLKQERVLVPGQVDAGALVSTVAVMTDPTKRLETRGDGKTRMFDYSGQTAPGRLKVYGDFQSHNTTLQYDENNAAGLPGHVIDANNHTTGYSHTAMSSQIASVTHPDGTTASYGYCNDDHYLASKTDELLRVTTFTRDSFFRITRTDYPDTSYETFVYNAWNQVTKHRRKNGAFEYFLYDANTHLLLKQWNPTFTDVTDGTGLASTEPFTTFSYYIAGQPWQYRLQTKTLPANAQALIATETYEYDKLYVNGVNTGAACAGRGLVTKITHNISDPTPTSQLFTFNIYGNKLSETNELGQQTTYVYDQFKRVTSVTNPLGQTASSVYSTLPNVLAPMSQTDVSGVTTSYTYDEKFQPLTKTVGYGTPLAATSTFTYDPMGNPLLATDPLNHTTSTIYDVRDRKTSVTAGYGSTIAETTSFVYDAVSNVTSVTRPDGKTEYKTYDVMNRVLTDTLPVTDTSSKIIGFSYLPSGLPQWVSVSQTASSSEKTWYAYDASDRKTRFIYPDNSDPLNPTDYQEWTYDNVGNVTARRTVNGVTQNFTFDSRNRNVHMGWTDTVPGQANFVTDSADFQYDVLNRIRIAANPNSTVTRDYDAVGRMKYDTQALLGGGTQTVQYAYDTGTGNAGRMTEMNIGGTGNSSSGYTGGSYDVRYSYDARGRMLVMSDPTHGNLAQYTYDSASNVTRRDTLLNSTYLTYGTRDALNRMPNRAVVVGGATISNETYGYDNMNRLTSTDRTEDSKRDQFAYDYESQMTNAQYGLVGGINPNRTVGYTLDLVGNRTNVTDGGIAYTYTPNNINQYGQTGADVIGNGSEHEIASYKNVSYGYINDGRLTTVVSTGNAYAIKYDAFGRTVSRTLNGSPTTYYYYDGEKAIVETGGTTASNVYGLGVDEIVLRFETGDTKFFYQNHEGSVTHVRNANGVMIESYRYDAFGAPYNATTGQPLISSAIGNRFLFTGREYNYTFGFYEYRARAYHPVLGRFMSEDPKGFDAGDYNLFRYCGNDPEDRADPTGLQDAKPLDPQREDILRKQNGPLGPDQGNRIQEALVAQNTIRGEMALRNAQQVEAKAKQCAQAPDKTGYAAGQPYMAERTALNYDPKVQKDGNLTSTSTVIIKLKDKDGNPVAEGTQVREVAPLTVQQQKDVYPSKTRVEGFVERTDSTGQLKNPDYWQHTFTSKSGYVVKTQELVSGDKHLYWDARQTPQGVEIYTHQTGYFYGQ